MSRTRSLPTRTTRRALRGSTRLRADARGATIIEFALIAPAFVAVLLAIIATSLVFFAQEALETAAEQAARQITTGQTQTSGTTQQQFQAVACQGLYAFMSCSNLIVDVEKYSSFSGVSTAPPTITFDGSGNVSNTWQYQTGGAGDIVVLRLMYIWRMPTGPLGFSVGNIDGNRRLLVATTVAKTEPYSS